jgi:hypothetical protein
MSLIHIPFLSDVNVHTPVHIVSELLEKQEKQPIHIAPWPQFPYGPAVSFAIAYSTVGIIIQYNVTEKEVRAIYNQPNDPVYKDSCVEFFVSFDEKGYYNFEFNCIGTCLAAFGPDRHNRTLLPGHTIQKIKSLSHIYRSDNRSEAISWQLTIVLPLQVFLHHSFVDLKNKTARANFYKCGDDLAQPHYLCWSPIASPQPDFHLPQFFGAIQFS